MKFNLLTIFPDSLKPYIDASILKKAQDAGAIKINLINIRDYADDKHKTVDDTPYGGGAGMVMKVEPIHKALQAIDKPGKIIALTPRGTQFTQQTAQEYYQLESLTLIAGRYEGIDQRVLDYLIDEEITVGPYVLSGGELPALTIIEATTRLIPGVLGNIESLQDSEKTIPQYTKPEEYKSWSVPEVLLSGNHEEIKKWRNSHHDNAGF